MRDQTPTCYVLTGGPKDLAASIYRVNRLAKMVVQSTVGPDVLVERTTHPSLAVALQTFAARRPDLCPPGWFEWQARQIQGGVIRHVEHAPDDTPKRPRGRPRKDAVAAPAPQVAPFDSGAVLAAATAYNEAYGRAGRPALLRAAFALPLWYYLPNGDLTRDVESVVVRWAVLAASATYTARVGAARHAVGTSCDEPGAEPVLPADTKGGV
jgi:hypothetical protein